MNYIPQPYSSRVSIRLEELDCANGEAEHTEG
jgi:hypothetical protein